MRSEILYLPFSTYRPFAFFALVVCLFFSAQCRLAHSQIPRLGNNTTSKTQAPELPQPRGKSEAQIVRLPSFKNITPGRTTLAETKIILGKPTNQFTVNDETTMTFEVVPFTRVEIIGDRIKVMSIVIHLAEMTEYDKLAKELEISSIRPAPILDASGELLGQVYPERGIVFGFAENDRKKVAQIMLEPIRAESFILRAEFDIQHNHESSINDLEYARQLEPGNAHVYWLLASLQRLAGDKERALHYASKAVKLDGQSAPYRLTKSRMLAENRQFESALLEAVAVLESGDLPGEVLARGECLVGDLIAGGLAPDYSQSIKHHLRAIEIASKLSDDERFLVRRAAKKVLLDAHLAVAEDVAFGNFRRKSEVVPKWLRHAAEIATDMIKNEQSDVELRLLVNRKALEIYAAIGSVGDPSDIAKTAIADAEKTLRISDDKVHTRHARRWHAEVLFYLASIQHRRGETELALAHAQETLGILKHARLSESKHDELLGQAYFLIGSIHAIDKQDHETAVSWYDMALESLPQTNIPGREVAIAGDRFVAIGVSYWNIGRREDAIKLTKRGATFIKQAVSNQLAMPEALAIPYGNLAGMCKKLGRNRDAEQYAEIAAKLKTPDAATQQR